MKMTIFSLLGFVSSVCFIVYTGNKGRNFSKVVNPITKPVLIENQKNQSGTLSSLQIKEIDLKVGE